MRKLIFKIKNKPKIKNYIIFFVIIFFVILTNNVFAADFGDNPNLKLQVPILGYSEAADLAEYIGNVFQAGLFLLVPIAIIVIMYGGMLWVFAGGNPSQIGKAKKYMSNAFLGLTIGLLSYVMLSFVGIRELSTPGVESVEAIEYMDENTYFEMLGLPPGMFDLNVGSSSYQGAADPARAAQAAGVHICVAETLLKKESSGRPDAIGHDENVTRLSTRARKDFINSGKKYSGAPITSNSATNDDSTKACSKPDLCLDWRFSHGIGLGQLTVGGHLNDNCNGNPSRKFSGKCYKPHEMLNPTINLELSLLHWKGKHPSDPWKRFKGYNGADSYANEAMKIYNACCAQKGGC